MSERPILFSAEMVRAILAGRKTQTRRPVRGVPFGTNLIDWNTADKAWVPWDWTSGVGSYAGGSRTGDPLRCPLGQPGDRLWVRETWGLHAHCDYTDWNRDSIAGVSEDDIRGSWAVAYQSDAESPYDHWRPSIHMPRWASRITLEITDVRVQRVQDVTSADIEADIPSLEFYSGPGAPEWSEQRRSAWAALWSSIYGAESWQRNAWVWAVTFRRLP